MALGGVTPTVNTNYNTTSNPNQVDSAIANFIGKDANGNLDGSAIQKSNPGLWQWAEDNWSNQAPAGTDPTQYVATMLGGYEQWMENQALNTMSQCSDDMSQDDDS